MRLLLLLLLWNPDGSWSLSSDDDDDKGVSCRNENNQKVDWFILYKAPSGLKYSYISTNGEETPGKDISATDGALAYTLSPMLMDKPPKTFGFLSYSDQPPDGATVSPAHGHSKGVVFGDSGTKTAVWITHSTPKFPKERSLNGFWPKSGTTNAQTFMCVTLTFVQLQQIGVHLQKIRANTFDKNIPASFPKEIIDAANNKGPDPHFIQLTIGNMLFQAVAKGIGEGASDGDLYVQLSRQFNSNMNAKTWCQKGQDGSYCVTNQHQVLNVIKVETGLKKEWEWTSDHSKWAVTTGNNGHWTCVADMNRAGPQYQRPGGALCIQNQGVSNIFKGFVKSTMQCRKRPRECLEEMDTLSDNLEELNLDEHEEF